MVGTSLFMASCLADIPVFFGYSVTRIRRFGRILYISLAFSVLFFLLFCNELSGLVYPYAFFCTLFATLGAYGAYLYLLMHNRPVRLKALLFRLFIITLAEGLPLALMLVFVFHDNYHGSFVIKYAILFICISKIAGGLYIHSSLYREDTGCNTSIISAVCALVVMGNAYSVFRTYFGNLKEYDLYAVTAMIYILICLLCLAIRVVNRVFLRRQEAAVITHQEEADAKYGESMIEADTRQKILVHDIKNHLLTIRELSREGKSAEACEYINELIDTSMLPREYCSNSLLNSILRRYASEFKKAGADYEVNVFGPALSNMSAGDTTALMCNLLDNAYHAVEKQAPGSGFVTVIIRGDESLTTVSVTNSCETTPFDSEGKLPSGTEDGHGLGIKSVRRIAEKYDGQLELYYSEEDKEFHAVVMVRGV